MQSKLRISDIDPLELEPYTPSLLSFKTLVVQTAKRECTLGEIKGTTNPFPISDVPVAQQPETAAPMIRQHNMINNDNHKAEQPKRPTPAVYHPSPANPPATELLNRASMQQHTDERTGMSDITRLLVRLELVSSGLMKFSDRPECYWAWRSSFLNTTEGVTLSVNEEHDFLAKSFGNQSSEHVRRTLFVHVANPATGLRMPGGA